MSVDSGRASADLNLCIQIFLRRIKIYTCFYQNLVPKKSYPKIISLHNFLTRHIFTIIFSIHNVNKARPYVN